MMRPQPQPHSHQSWFVIPKPNPTATLRLFCIPYAGGNAFAFRSWPQRLPPEVEVCAIQLPGRGTRLREPLHTNVHRLVEELGPALVPFLDRPFCMLGHSLGAVVSFEITRWLRRQRRPLPRHLIVSGRRAPHLVDNDEKVHLLGDDAFVDSLRRLEGTPEQVLASPELLQLMMPILRADFQMGETYEYRDEPPLPCPVTAFGGTEDTETQEGRLEAWRDQTTARFAFHWYEGGHFFLQTSEQRLLARVAEALTKA